MSLYLQPNIVHFPGGLSLTTADAYEFQGASRLYTDGGYIFGLPSMKLKSMSLFKPYDTRKMYPPSMSQAAYSQYADGGYIFRFAVYDTAYTRLHFAV